MKTLTGLGRWGDPSLIFLRNSWNGTIPPWPRVSSATAKKVLIGVAVAHAIQCPYCIDAYSKSCLEEGMSLEHITEAVHVASAVRGGASLIHAIQAHNSIEKISL